MINKIVYKYSIVLIIYMFIKIVGSLYLGVCVMVYKLRKCLFQELFVRGFFIGEKNLYSKILFLIINKICFNVLMYRGCICVQI